jgi:hypothetical protein
MKPDVDCRGYGERSGKVSESSEVPAAESRPLLFTIFADQTTLVEELSIHLSIKGAAVVGFIQRHRAAGEEEMVSKRAGNLPAEPPQGALAQ